MPDATPASSRPFARARQRRARGRHGGRRGHAAMVAPGAPAAAPVITRGGGIRGGWGASPMVQRDAASRHPRRHDRRTAAAVRTAAARSPPPPADPPPWHAAGPPTARRAADHPPQRHGQGARRRLRRAGRVQRHRRAALAGRLRRPRRRWVPASRSTCSRGCCSRGRTAAAAPPAGPAADRGVSGRRPVPGHRCRVSPWPRLLIVLGVLVLLTRLTGWDVGSPRLPRRGAAGGRPRPGRSGGHRRARLPRRVDRARRRPLLRPGRRLRRAVGPLPRRRRQPHLVAR